MYFDCWPCPLTSILSQSQAAFDSSKKESLKKEMGLIKTDENCHQMKYL